MGICLPYVLHFGGISLAWLDPQDEKYAQKVLFAISLLYGITIILGQSAYILLRVLFILYYRVCLQAVWAAPFVRSVLHVPTIIKATPHNSRLTD